MTRNTQKGFSLVEVIISAAIFMVLVVVVSSLAITGSDAQDLGRRISKMTEVAQEVADDIRLQMVSSARVFGNDTSGRAMMGILDLGAAPTPAGVRRLPTIDQDGPFRQDTLGDEITGNTILFAYLAWRDRYRCISGKDYLVDVYRMVHYYMSPADGGPGPNVRGGLDLVHFVSEPLADGDAINNITDPIDRAELLLHLHDSTPDAEGRARDPVQVVWLRAGEPDAVGTLRQIDDNDGSLSDDVLPATGRPDPWQILPSADGVARLLAFRRASVASNFDVTAPGISRFAVRDDANGFPHGLEFQVIGPTAARQMLLHLVLVDTARKGQPAWSQMQTIITAHDR
jgi:hypothetical protein